MNRKKENSLFGWMLAGFALAAVVLHMLTAYNYELHRDGMLYFAMGDHLATGYISTPPLIGIVSFLIRHTAGYSIFAIKLVPALLGATSLVTDVNFRENGLKVFLCTDPKTAFGPFYAAKVNELKSMYRR